MEQQVATQIQDAFISYGRKDSKDFAIRLRDLLYKENLNVWLDLEDIDIAEDWRAKIEDGISRAKHFLFIISPHSLYSVHCKDEIETAISYGKRIIPILHVEKNLNKLHPKLEELNWLKMREEEKDGVWQEVDDIETAAQKLCNIVKEHSEYLKLHTLILLRALEWRKNFRPSHLLPTDKDREIANTWLERTLTEQVPVPPTHLHCEFICEARKNAENMMTDVFIAYAQEDIQVQESLNICLMRNGITGWREHRDFQASQDYSQTVKQGIEQADNFLIMVSPSAIDSNYLLRELQHAQQLNKRIIAILVEPVPIKDLPEAMRGLQLLDYSECAQDGRCLRPEKFEEVPILLKKGAEHFHRHKQLLVQALKWERFDRPDSMLLRGFNLENAEAWLMQAKSFTRESGGAVAIQKELVEVSRSKVGLLKTEVFLSYSRKDGDFARLLNQKLQLYGKTTWFDQENISEGEDFQQEILNGIESSENFVFLISEDSVTSQFCDKELNHAISLSKRIIPVLCRTTQENIIPEVLGKIQWISFVNRSFEVAFGKLVQVMETDREHVTQHTYWQQQASEWEKSSYNNDLLIGESRYPIAADWLEKAISTHKNPAPTQLQEKYFEASLQAIEQQNAKEISNQKKIKRLLMLSNIGFIAAVLVGVFTVNLYWKSEEAKNELVHIQRATLEYFEIGKMYGFDSERTQSKRDSVGRLSTRLTPFYDGQFFGYKNILDSIVIKPRFSEASAFSGNDFARVEKNEYDFEINRYGKLVNFLDSENGKKYPFRRGVAIIPTANGKWQLLSSNAEVIPNTTYDYISDKSYSGVTKVKNDGKYGMLSLDGRLVLPIEYDEIDTLAPCGVSRILKNGKWGLVNTMGKVKVKPEYDLLLLSADNEKGGCIVSLEKGDRKFRGHLSGSEIQLLTIINIDGSKEELDFGGESINLAPLKNDAGLWGYLNRQAVLKVPYQFDQAWPFDHKTGFAVAQKGSKFLIINRKGEISDFPLVRYSSEFIKENPSVEKAYVHWAFAPQLDLLSEAARRAKVKLLITDALHEMDTVYPSANFNRNELGMGIKVNLFYGSNFKNQFLQKDFRRLADKVRQGGNVPLRIDDEDKSILELLEAAKRIKGITWGGFDTFNVDNGLYLVPSNGVKEDYATLQRVQAAYQLAEKYQLGL